ncbi:MAG: hypothetical protein CSB24_02770 [Deltaproteobacteria bacterium]|nr:MAG: hypothetical protein CSB24_02770 [Deltaproteobacteria bacterium]
MRYFRLIFLFFQQFFFITAAAADQPDNEPLQLLKPQGVNQPPDIKANIMQQDIKDIAGPVPLPDDWLPTVFIGTAAIIILLLLIFLFVRWRKNRAKPALSPRQRTEQELAEAKKLFTEARFAEYSEVISRILRRFITTQFKLRATTRTTREFLQQIQKDKSSDALFRHRDLLADCLSQMDLIKFARFSPGESEAAGLEKAVISFIRESCEEEIK